MKFVFSLFLAILLCSCSTTTKESDLQPIDLIPSSSIFIFQSDDLANSASVLLENSFLKEQQDLPIFKQISSQVAFFSLFETDASGVLCFSAVGKKDIASSFIASSKDLDFLKLNTGISDRKTFEYEGKEVNEFSWENKKLYAVWFGEMLLVSDNKLIVENKIRDVANSIAIDEAFARVVKTVDSSTPSLFIQVNEFQELYKKAFEQKSYALFSKLTDWVALDLKIEENQLQLSGVGVIDVPNTRKLALLKNQDRIPHEVAQLVALNAIGFESYSITETEAYLAQRKAFGLPANTTFVNVFEAVEEVSKIYYPKEDVVVLRSTKAASTFEALQGLMDAEKTFRGVEFFQLKETDVLQMYAPLIVLNPATYVCQIDDFFVFAASIEALENTIINHVNGFNLQQQPNYQAQVASLSSSSSALFYALSDNWATYMQTKSQADFTPNFKTLAFNDYKGIALQLNIDEEYAYLNAVLKAVKKENKSISVKQKARFKLPTKSLTQAQLFTNWRTQQRDVFVQDQNLQAQLFDTDGNAIWSRKLEEVIMGKVVEFDIYKNTRLQLAFATQNKVYVLDKNGDDVSPFPISLLNNITQPLQIFDYDNNGNYRFMITQGKQLKAYDKGGNLVEGFSFTAQDSEISHPPKHIRIGTKDYILVQEASGKLHILDRRGEERVAYTTNVQFSGNPWFLYDGKFTSTTADGDLVQISEEGSVVITKKELSPSHFMAANQRLLVTLSENILQLNEVEIELDYGLYTSPQILQTQDKSWVSLTDTQSKKLYVFDEFGNLVKGFPVYGNSTVDYFSTEASKIQLMVKGEEESILMYELE